MPIEPVSEDRAPLHAEVVTAMDRLSQLEVLWKALIDVAPAITPFAEFAFILLWWKFFQDAGCKLRVVAVWQRDVLVGLLPLYQRRSGPFGLIPTLHPIGQGEAEHEEVCAEYPDLIVAPGMEKQVADVAAQALLSLPGWWRLELRDVLPESFWMTELMPRLHDQGLPVKRASSGVRYWVDLPESWDGYLSGLKHNYRRKINLSRRRTEEAPGARVEHIDSAEHVEAAMQTLAKLHANRWALVGEKGAFASPRFNQFHVNWARTLLEHNQLRLTLLHINEEPVAAIYQIHAHGTTYYYQSGSDVEKWAGISPGKYMLSLGIEQAIAAEDRIYDFMRGADMSYKKDYGCTTADVFLMRAFRRSPGGGVAMAIEALKVRFQRLLGRLA